LVVHCSLLGALPILRSLSRPRRHRWSPGRVAHHLPRLEAGHPSPKIRHPTGLTPRGARSTPFGLRRGTGGLAPWPLACRAGTAMMLSSGGWARRVVSPEPATVADDLGTSVAEGRAGGVGYSRPNRKRRA